MEYLIDYWQITKLFICAIVVGRALYEEIRYDKEISTSDLLLLIILWK